VRITIENPLLRTAYPAEEGTFLNAAIDTGHQGFLAIPAAIYGKLELDKIKGENRRVVLADGSVSKSRGAYATLRIPHLSMKMDGFIETFRGLDEVMVGVEALVQLKLILDFCVRKAKLEKCLVR
jgi:clan AA aspartic protease